MRYFQVEKEKLYGDTFRYAVNSDGTCGGENYSVDGDKGEVATAVVVGFSVFFYDENGMIVHTEFYPVKSDMSKSPVCDDTGDWVFENNEREVLAKIADDYPAPDYQNNMW